MGKSPEVLTVPQFLDSVGDIRGEEDCNEQEPEDRASVRDRGDPMFDHLLLGPVGGRYRKHLVEEQPF